MKICLYSPYVPQHLGGGEKYFFDVAKTLVEMGHDVSVAAVVEVNEEISKQIKEKYETFLGYSLADIHFISAPFTNLAITSKPQSFWQKLIWTKQWDVLYYVTDGSFFFSLAKKNIAHIQIPFTAPKHSLVERLKLANWSIKTSNSQFTKKIVEKSWQTKIQFVHQPMIEPPIKLTESNLPHILAEKKKMILHVGRFFSHLHTKKQDVLVEVFRQLLEKYPAETKDWELVLIGSVEDEKYYAVVKEAAKGLPIRLLQPNHSGLWQYYQMASIYWHATGFGSDEMNEPAKMEHFGISTVEAMSMGCVPVVIGQGGQVEVVGEKLKDLLWLTAEECINQTIRLIKDPQLRHQQAALAVEQSHQFGKEQFRNKLVKMI